MYSASNFLLTDSPKTNITVDLKYPNVVIDEYGNEGHWTMIYNQGFEFTVNQRTFFANFYYIQVISISHDLINK